MNLVEILVVSPRLVSALPKTAIVVCLLGCLAGTGCPPPSMSTECRDFFLRPASEREQLFKTYDLDKQLDLYRCGMGRRPPDSSLPLFIADRGETAIPTLLDKLDTEKDEMFQYGIIDIFEVMSVKGYLRNRRDVIERIRQMVAKMKISTFRDMSREALSQIEKNTFG
jgi:hypothetical protein